MGIATGPIYQRQKPVRDPLYLKFIRSMPSAKSGRYGCDPCHTGPTGQKASDLSCIPLSSKEHREFDADPRGCAERWGIDVPALIQRLNRAYELKQAGRVA